MNSAQPNTLELERKQDEKYQNFIRQQKELEICSDSLSFLKKYGKIRDKTKGIIDWEPWPHLVYLLACLAKHRFIVILKAKQIGITWLMAASNLHLAMYQEGANILTLSKGEDEATESLDYSRFVHGQLPDFLRVPKGKDQSSLITFPSVHSKIRALPSTEDTGVGFGGATRVVMDEFEYHRCAEMNFGEIYPAVERAGQLVILSTADNTRLNTKFKEVYNAAKAKENRFFPIFFPYNVLPERTQTWFDALDLPLWQKQCRYPSNEQDALKPLKAHKFFDENMIAVMRADCNVTPLKHELSDKYKTIRIYKLPEVGKKYLCYTDPSEGKQDNHATIIADSTGEEVASSHGKIPADMCAVIHDELVRLYNNAFNSFESGPGGAGGIMANKLKELGTPNICASLNVSKRPFTLDTKSGKVGWWTSKPLWDVAIWGLEEWVRTRAFTPRTIQFCDEAESFIIPEGEQPQKSSGGTDDFIDTWSRIAVLKTFLRTTSAKIESWDYSSRGYKNG